MFKKMLRVFLLSALLLLTVSCGGTTTITTTITTNIATTDPIYTLPDLTGIAKSEIATILNDLGVNYTFQYATSQDITEDNFMGYANDEVIGATINDNREIVVLIATPRNILPDLTGLNSIEIITALRSTGIEYEFVVVTDNTVPDQTFLRYGDSLEIGALVPSNFEVKIELGYNQTILPDLTGMIKEEIEIVLSDLNILYSFEYTEDDNYTEDHFSAYKDMQIGDYYGEGIVVVTLYNNSFTSNLTSLIISKYVDGGDFTDDKAIEIFNPTNANIDLADYYLAIYRNGSLDMTFQIQFGDVILTPGETFVIANSSANGNILVKADLSSADLSFDGNDTIQICYSNGTYIDSIYNIGNKDYIMDNEVFIRDASVVTGTREYVFNQWHGFIPTYVEVLGTHPVTLPEKITISITSRGFYDPLGGMDLVTLSYINDGDTAGFVPGFIDDERVRFLGVDTPETFMSPSQEWGDEGKAYTSLILNNAERIYIQSDPDMGYTGGYGRHLGLVWVDLGAEGLTIDITASDGITVMRTETLTGWILLNYYLVLNGFSYNYYGGDSTLTFNDRYIVRWFQEAEKFASDNGLGVHE